MRALTTPESLDMTYPLSPFQRIALGCPSRPVTLTVEVNASVAEGLAERTEHALSDRPELTGTIQMVAGLRVPRQVPNPPSMTFGVDGGWRLHAGSLSVRAEPCAAGTRLTVESDAMFADARSLELFLRRIADPSSPVAPVTFFDVAAGHAAMAQEGELDQEKRYWEAIACADETRAALGSVRGPSAGRVTVSVPVSARAAAHLEEFAKAHGQNLSDVLYLGLQLLVYRVCPGGAVIGRMTDARGLMGLESTSGSFTQVVPDVADIDSGATPLTMLARQAERLSRHADMAGGPALAEEALPPTVIFDARTDWALPDGWRLVDAFEARSGALLLRGQRRGTGLCLIVDACEGEQPQPLRAILAAWVEATTALSANPDAPWRSSTLGTGDSPDEVARELRATTDRPAAADLCARMHELAMMDPDALAARHGTVRLTRQTLLRRIGDLSETLGDVAPGEVVAVLSEPEPDLLAGWLAVLWRGAVFLPLSPVEPRQRIEQALQSSGASAVLVGSDAPAFTAPAGCRVVLAREVATAGRDPGPPAQVSHSHPAYLLRTSGSTGKPKLVCVRRGSLNNYLRWVAEDLLDDGEDLPVLSSPVFDASFKQLLGPQYAGYATWLLQGDRTDPAQVWAELVIAGRPLSINCVPSYWAELVRAGQSGQAPLPLHRLFLGGEPMSKALLRRTAREYPGTEIWNLYGPTEATATATAGRLLPGEPVHAGTAVAGALVAVADADGRALPRGMRGEVWVAGPGRASGYLGDADQSAFAELRIGDLTVPAYRTGDSGRLDAQGKLVLEGRLDEQLKMRGWRIEPGEIERVAEEAPGVTGAVVVLDERIQPAALRMFILGVADEATVLGVLRASLPTPMVPASVTSVDRFPRTSTGKVDRRRLLDRLPGRPEASPDSYGPLELEVATVWRQVVGHGWPHADEEFFSAGGHSLLLSRLVNQLRARGHRSLSLRQVVRNPTVASIAALIRADEAS